MVLVTGGFGFIGNELVRQLMQHEDVVVLDNQNRVATRIEDLAPAKTIRLDLTDHTAVAAVITKLRPRTVIHLAAIHYIPECNADPERTLRVNVEGTMGLVKACVAAKVEHFLLASSGAVYADSALPLNESARVAPVDIYGFSKRFAEELCIWQAEHAGLPVTICRLFNNVGPRETNAHIIPEILNQLRSSDELKLGNTTPRRDFIHTRDTAKALRGLMGHAPGTYRIVNVASGFHASVDEIIVIIGELLGRKLRVVQDLSRYRKADKQVQVADITALRRLLGWTPEISLRAGLEDLLRFEGFLG